MTAREEGRARRAAGGTGDEWRTIGAIRENVPARRSRVATRAAAKAAIRVTGSPLPW
jgi:hypothetical protein